MQEIINKYLTVDQKHIKKMTPNNALKSKQDLFQILKWWKMLSNANTIGETHINGNTPTIRINLGSNNYVINADTNKEGVAEFLKNKEHPLILIENENGIQNKITNNENKSPIKGFYMYKI
jgi:hypothetical protein